MVLLGFEQNALCRSEGIRSPRRIGPSDPGGSLAGVPFHQLRGESGQRGPFLLLLEHRHSHREHVSGLVVRRRNTFQLRRRFRHQAKLQVPLGVGQVTF